MSDLQKSALPPGFTDLRLAGDTTLILHPVGRRARTGLSKTSSRRRVFTIPNACAFRPPSPASARRPPSARVSLVLNGKVLQTKTVDVPAGRPAARTSEFPVGSTLPPPTDSTAAKCASIRPTRCPATTVSLLGGAHRSARRSCSSTTAAIPTRELYYRAALDSSPDAAFQLEVQRPETAANGKLADYALVVLDDLGPLPPGSKRICSATSTPADRCWWCWGRLRWRMPKVPVEGDPIQAASYAGPRRRALPDRFRYRFGASGDAAAWNASTA